jgi:Tfp pilus assembly protein PilO
MPKSYSPSAWLGVGTAQLKLRVTLLVMLLLNLGALFLYMDPPGGSPQDLTTQDQQIRNQIAAMSLQGSKMQHMATLVETGSSQIAAFEKQYFLPKRVAYGAVIEEIQRMTKISGLQERDAGLSEEPIEGANDLSLLIVKANYEGTYPSLMRFLYEADRSPMFLMLDSLTAAPEQKNGQISADIRFQVIIQEPPLTAGGQP